MTETQIPLARLEAINDLIAQGIDSAGPEAEIFLAKALYHLAAHVGAVEDLKAALAAGLRDL